MSMPRLFSGLLAVLALLTVSVPAVRAQDNPVVATVNGTEIRQNDLVAAEEEAGQLPPMSTDAKKDYLVQFMADMILITKAAEDKKIGDDATFKRRLDFARKKMLMEGLLASVATAASTDAAMRAVYDDAVTKLPNEEEVHARHILFRAAEGDEKAGKEAEGKAKAVIARLNKGEDFQKVANELTEDPSGKANGGDLGYFTKEQMVPEFATVAFGLAKGKISGPVKTQFGWHVIQVVGRRTEEPPTFEDEKDKLRQSMAQEAVQKQIAMALTAVKVQRFNMDGSPVRATDALEPPAAPK